MDKTFENWLVVSDIDGTLNNKFRRLPKKNYDAIKKFPGEAKAFSLGLCPAQRIEITMTAGGSHTTTTRCHAFWRDGCGALPLSGQSGNSYLVPSTPVTADAVPPSVSRRGLSSVSSAIVPIFTTQILQLGGRGMENITTHSTGTEPNRRVVIEYVR